MNPSAEAEALLSAFKLGRSGLSEAKFRQFIEVRLRSAEKHGGEQPPCDGGSPSIMEG